MAERLYIWGLETFSNSIHWWRKDENVIPRSVAWSDGLKFEKSNYDKKFYLKNSTVNKLIPSAIEMNELWWRSSLDYFKKVTCSIPVLRSATKGSSIGKSVHTRVRTEVRHKVHVRTEVSRVHSKEEMILDLQLHLNSVEEKLKPGQSNVDHLGKTNNLSKNAPDCGHDQRPMGGVSQCMNVDEPYKGVNQCTGLNDEYESVAVDGLISLWSQDFVDSPQVKVNDNEEACHSDYCVSRQQVRGVINHFFHTPSVQIQDDVNVNSVVEDDVNVDSLVKEDIEKDDVHVDSFVKEDIEKDDVHVDSFVKEDIEKDDVQFDSVVKDAEKRRREIKLETTVILFISISGRNLSAGATLKEAGHLLLEPNADWVMASPYLCDMLSRFQFLLYYADGVKYGVPWFANNVHHLKHYFGEDLPKL
nr:hypothetical protein [Tanacetum cinerariifolium]